MEANGRDHHALRRAGLVLVAVTLWACATPEEEGDEPRVDFLAGAPVNGLHPGAGMGGTGGAGGIGGVGGVGGVAGMAGFGGMGGTSGVGGFGSTGGSGGASGTGGSGGISGVGGSGGIGGMVGGSGGISGVGGTGGSAGVGGTSGTGGAAGTGGVAGTGGGPHPTQLVVDYTTLDQRGRYAPKNVGAAWIERAGGGFVKTMEAWYFIRGGNLSKFNGASFGNRVDAITSATLGNHKAHHNTWNLKDANGAAMPDGQYQVVLECTDRDGSSKSIVLPFTLGPNAETTTPTGDSAFSNITISLQ